MTAWNKESNWMKTITYAENKSAFWIERENFGHQILHRKNVLCILRVNAILFFYDLIQRNLQECANRDKRIVFRNGVTDDSVLVRVRAFMLIIRSFA